MAAPVNPLIASLRAGQFRQVDNYLSQLPDEELREQVLVLLHGYEDESIDQDGFINMMYFYRHVVEEISTYSR